MGVDNSESVFKEFLLDKYPAVFDKYNVCGREPILWRCSNEGCNLGYRTPNSCGVRGCPVCSGYNQKRIFKRYLPALQKLDQKRLRKVELTYGHLKPEFSGDDIRAIYSDFQRVLSFFWSTYLSMIEFSPNGHFHVHALAEGRYVSQKALSDKAREVLGKPVVWIRRAKPGKALGYMIKDGIKTPVFHDPKFRCAWYEATRGLRMFRSRGLLYGLKPDSDGLRCPVCGAKLFFEGTMSIDGWGLSEWAPYTSRPPNT